MDHENLVELEKQGKILIGVDRAIARKFYTDIPMKEIEEETGEAPYFEKIIIFTLFLLNPLLLLISIVLGFWFFSWWGIVYLILLPLIYFTYFSFSSMGNSGMGGINLLLLIMIVGYFFKILLSPQIFIFIIIFLFSLWCARSLYCFSTLFFRNFIIRNEKAYQYLLEHLTIRYVE
ncbi:MAG: hypothetical protein WC290_02815 [archaeon]|jgi:hypothetical protein